MAGLRVLCVDPDQESRGHLREAIRTDLADMDPVVEACPSIADADVRGDTDTIDCLITEYDLPDGTGLELAGRLREAHPDADVILFTGRSPDSIPTDDGDTIITEYIDKTAAAAPARVTSLLAMTASLGSQLSYPLPDDEAERLAALRRYDLESPALTAGFDRITDLAVQHFDIETASINIIEEHEQKLLACKGMGTATRSTSREASICTFTIVADDRVMTVEDVREDPRFESRHEDLEAIGIRSYMGAQVVAPTGFPIGTLCVYDDDVRQFSAAERGYLRTLADLVGDLLVVASGSDQDGTDTQDRTADDDLTAAEEAFR